MERPSATLLVAADYSTGATASVSKAFLPLLLREGMGWGSIMGQFGGLGQVEKFADVLDGQGVAALLMRDRDGQLKVGGRACRMYPTNDRILLFVTFLNPSQVSALAPPRPGSILEGEKGEAQANDGFISKLVACEAAGKVMDFTVSACLGWCGWVVGGWHACVCEVSG